MAKKQSSTQKQTANRIYGNLSLVAAVVLLILSGLALWGNTFIGNMVRTELAAQKVYFPPKGSTALDPTEFPDLQQYGGQLVDTPEEAKAYANGFIGRHLESVANGKVYAEVSAEAMKDPKNAKLQQQKQTLFQGETLRGILLGTGYAFGTIGEILGVVAWSALVLGVVAAVTGLTLRSRS